VEVQVLSWAPKYKISYFSTSYRLRKAHRVALNCTACVALIRINNRPYSPISTLPKATFKFIVYHRRKWPHLPCNKEPNCPSE